MARPKRLRSASKPIPKGRACRLCQVRWAQRRGGLCAGCVPLADRVTTQTIERERIERAQAKLAHVLRVDAPIIRDARTMTIRGVEYEVAWDGSFDGAHARGIPRADERPGGYMDGHYRSGLGRKESTAQTVSSKRREPLEGGF